VYNIDGILPHMKSRIDKMAEWGCDYTEFDNMDWCTDAEYRKKYGSTPGQKFPAVDKCAGYNKKLCDYSKKKSMRCMAKSSGYTDDADEYAGGDEMDAITFESYLGDFNWWSNEHLQGFLDNDKPVVIVHYDGGSNEKKNSCDYFFNKYQDRYNSDKISYICESGELRKYVHYSSERQPTPSPAVTSKCLDNKEILFIIDLKTDNRAVETSYDLKMKVKKRYNKKIASGKNFENDTVYSKSFCLLAKKKYKFTLKDSGKDGFAHGDGYFRLTLDGKVIKYSVNDKPKKRIAHKFKTSCSKCDGGSF